MFFVLGSFLAGLGGALAASERSIVSQMGNSILIESFIITVIGGMGSIGGAFLASLIIGMARSFGAVAMPLFTDGLMFLIMVFSTYIKATRNNGRKKVMNVSIKDSFKKDAIYSVVFVDSSIIIILYISTTMASKI